MESDLIVIERGAWACLASIIAHSKNRKVRSKNKQARIEGIRRLAFDLTKYEDFFIYIDISIEESLKRDKESGATHEGKIINKIFLPILQAAYQEIREQMPCYKVRVINGEDDIQKNQAKLKKMLLDIVSKKT